MVPQSLCQWAAVTVTGTGPGTSVTVARARAAPGPKFKNIALNSYRVLKSVFVLNHFEHL